MTIFKKISPLEGNACRPNGINIEFDGLYYETDDEDDIKFLSGFKCYKQVEARDSENQKELPKQAKATTGVISAASLAGIAAKNS